MGQDPVGIQRIHPDENDDFFTFRGVVGDDGGPSPPHLDVVHQLGYADLFRF